MLKSTVHTHARLRPLSSPFPTFGHRVSLGAWSSLTGFHWLDGKPWGSSHVCLLSPGLTGAELTLSLYNWVQRHLSGAGAWLAQMCCGDQAISAAPSLLQRLVTHGGAEHFPLLLFLVGVFFGEASAQIFCPFLKLTFLFLPIK